MAKNRVVLLLSVVAGGALAIMGMSGCTGVASPSPKPSAPVPAAPTSLASAATPTAGVTQLDAGSLVVEEHPIVPTSAGSPTAMEYWRLIDPMILEKRKEWRETPLEGMIPGANEHLKTFGYRLSKTEQPGCPICVIFGLFQGEKQVLSELSHFQSPVLTEKGDDFLIVVEGRRGESHLVRKTGVTVWKPSDHAYLSPRFLDGELLAVWSPGLDRYELRKGDTILHAGTLASPRVDSPFKSLWVWQGRWVLEIDGEVLDDGKSLNSEKGYAEIFGSRLLKDEPFYFFEAGGGIGMSYAGQELPQRYDEVIHYRCCEPAAFNLQGNNNMVWFHARRDGKWYYVEAGIYPPAGPEARTTAPKTR